eukprot:TRINITY_DN42149_c0_g1_i1.p1 TRINITY_DN42149_c0_g1~~TRINITY_DN42149_c0_g1_i1.p1  ORF type:complete len:385 (-),score=92.27 TRINITY_DN42149_c0_g1_i1:118-1272(-)
MMEVAILDAANTPAKPVLAVHVGKVRKQVKLEVNQPFRLPDPGCPTASVEVSVFQQLASQLLPDDGKTESTCSIPVRRPDGVASQVKLKVRKSTSTGEAGGVKNAEDVGKDCVGVKKDYLDSHHLQQRIQGLIQDVLREQPDDPYRYMLSQLRKVQAGEASLPDGPREEAATEAPAEPKEALVPRPPDKPKPAGNRPAPAAGRTIVPPKVQLDYTGWKLSRHILRYALESPKCRAASEFDLRDAVCDKAAKAMAKDVLDEARQRAVKKALSESTPKEQAKVVIRSACKAAAFYLSREYKRALAKWTVSYILTRAVNVIGRSEYADEVLVHTEHLPEPTPVVYLEASSSWAEWLQTPTGTPQGSTRTSPVPGTPQPHHVPSGPPL